MTITMGNSSIPICRMIKEYNGNFSGTINASTEPIYVSMLRKKVTYLPHVWRDRNVVVKCQRYNNSLKIYFD